MTTQNGVPWLWQASSYLERRKPISPIQFPEGEVITSPQTIIIRVLTGKLLRVPPATCALLTHPNGRLATYPPGEHLLNMAAGQYLIQFVDMRGQSLNLIEIRATSYDAWDVVLNVDVFWKVAVPSQVLQTTKLASMVERTCRSVVVDVIRTTQHDQLVSTPSEAPLAPGMIASRILNAIGSKNLLHGIEVSDILIMDIKGDQRRTEVVQKSIVRKTELEQSSMLQREQAHLDSEKMELEKVLAEKRRFLALQEAETSRLKLEEEERVRLRKADILAQEAQILQASQIQAVEIHQMEQQQPMLHEQMLKAMEVRGQAFAQLATALLQFSGTSGGIQRALDGSDPHEIQRALGILAKGIPEVTFDHTSPQPITGIETRVSMIQRVAQEIDEINLLPEYKDVPINFHPDGAGCWQVDVNAPALTVSIVYNDEYPAKPPVNIRVYKKDDTSVIGSFKLEWLPGMKLVNIIHAVYTHASSQRLSYPIKGNGSQMETHLVT